ncbi:MAG: hypothetical protein F4Z88_01585 [Chloroflexi bacterium]|nr:hypothetical protein [Chloroflexota bacterium]
MAEDFTRYANDPVGFVTDVLGDAGTPYSKQAEMLEALVDHRRVSVVGANGSGKDWAAGRAVLWWLETRPESKALTLGPTQRQVEEIVWREMREAYAAAADVLSGRMLTNAYRIDEQRFALGFSTNNALNIQGFHAAELLVVVTEAHAMPQAHIDAIKRLQPERLLLVGNALSRDGEFYASHHAKRNFYHRIAISAFDTPNFTGEDGGRRGMITPEYAEEYALDYGEDHPLYAASVLAQFPDALDDSLVGREAVESAMERWEASAVVPAEAGTSPPASHGLRDSREGGNDDGHLSPGERSAHDSAAGEGFFDPNEPVYIGVDVARYGFDKSAICVRQGQRVLSVRSFERMDTMRLVFEVRRAVRAWNAEAIFVDEGGVGGGVVDRLRELGAPVYGVHFGGGAQRPVRFFNRRSEIFWELRRLLERRLIAIPRDEELAGQLLGLRYDISSSGQIRLEGKPEMRRRGMPSPDKADALALAFLVPPSLGIWTGAEPFLRDHPPRPTIEAFGYDHPPPFSEPPPTDEDEDDSAERNRLGVW